jgi:transcriptional regulator with XRE-family HTH domain
LTMRTIREIWQAMRDSLSTMESKATMKTASQRLGENIAILRFQRGWRIDDLAEQTKRLGPSFALSSSTISRIETQNPRVDKPRAVRVEELETFAAVFGVSVQDLLIDSAIVDAKRFEAERVTYLSEMNQVRLHSKKATEALERMRKIASGEPEWLEYALEIQQEADGTLSFMKWQVENFNRSQKDAK